VPLPRPPPLGSGCRRADPEREPQAFEVLDCEAGKGAVGLRNIRHYLAAMRVLMHGKNTPFEPTACDRTHLVHSYRHQTEAQELEHCPILRAQLDEFHLQHSLVDGPSRS
jgi:hypothetical protein